MRSVRSVAEVRAAEAAAIKDVGEAVLIDRAAAAVARRAVQLLGSVYGSHVVVLAGKGHNGADALHAGWLLRQRGARVDVQLADEPADDHGAAPLRRLLASGARRLEAAPDDTDLVIDGLLGIGATGAPRGALADLVTAYAGHPAVLAVDIPSGVDADTGAVAGPVLSAAATVTFGWLKPGLVAGPGARAAGLVEVADIGLRDDSAARCAILDAEDVAALLPVVEGETSKYKRGVVGLVAGSAQYGGAAVLAAGGALRAGAGNVRLYATAEVGDLVRASWPEVVVVDLAQLAKGDPKVTAWVVGPGMGTDDTARSTLHAVLSTDRPVLADADALTLLAAEPDLLGGRTSPTVLTPHAGEFERLTGVKAASLDDDRIGVTRAAAAELGAVVLLKGLHTLVAAPDGTVRANPTGTPWLATAGSGDVLSGAVGAYLSAGLSALDAAAVGAWLHGLAARLAAGDGHAEASITATDVTHHWPDAVRLIRR